MVWLVAALVIGASPPTALAAAGWTKISTDDKSSGDSPSLALAGSSVVAAFPRVNGTWNAETDTFTPSTDASVLQGSIKRNDVVTGWGSVTPWLLQSASAPGGLQVMLSGGKDNTNDPLNGTSFAQRNADGSWAAPVPTGLSNGATSGSAVIAVAAPDNQTPIYAFMYGADLWLQVGATGRSQSTEVHIAATQLAGNIEASSPLLGRDAAGRIWLSWDNSNAKSPTGVYLLQIDPASGQPIGSAARAPKSNSGVNFGNNRTAMACAAECRVLYHEGDAQGNSTPNLDVWGAGDADSTRVSGPTQPNVSIAATAVPSGGMWIVWHEDGTPAYHAELASATGSGGSNQNLGQPTKDGLPVLNNAIRTSDGNLVFVTNWLDTASSTDAMWTRVIPGAAPVYSGPAKQTSTTIGNAVLTLVSPKNCVAANSRIIAKLFVKAVKKRHRKVGKGLVFIKVKSVDFGVDGKRRARDGRKPFKATLIVTGLTPGSKHTIYARALLKTHPGQPAIHRTVRSTFVICG